jgi:hypothetical protein
MSSVPQNGSPHGAPDPGSALARKRDAVLRRWLGMEVERSSVGDLVERPLSERLRELEELFDAAVRELRASVEEPPLEERRGQQLYEELAHAIERYEAIGVPFTLALLAAPNGDAGSWLAALTEAAEEGTRVLDAGEGVAAVILSGVKLGEADAAVDRLRALAWSATGCHGRLPGAGRAACPEDGTLPDQLVSAARERLELLSAPQARRFERGPSRASVTPLYPELS